MPSRMRAEVRSVHHYRRFFDDGKTITQFAPRLKYFGSVAAPGTIAEALQAVEQKYDMPVRAQTFFSFAGDDGAPNILVIYGDDIGWMNVSSFRGGAR